MTRIARLIYTLAAWLFVAGVITQVFFAGMAVVARRWSWDNHIELGFTLGLPILALVIFVFLGRFPRRVKLLTLLLPLVYLVQIFAIWSRNDAPLFSAFHPVMALIDFGLGLYLAVQATAVVRADVKAQATPASAQPQAGD